MQDDLEARQGEDLEEKPKAKVYDPYEFPENSFELRTTGGGHQEKRTPDSVKPIYQIANPGNIWEPFRNCLITENFSEIILVFLVVEPWCLKSGIVNKLILDAHIAKKNVELCHLLCALRN